MSAIGRALKKFRLHAGISESLLADQLFADGICGPSVPTSADLAQRIRRMEQGETFLLDDDLQTSFVEYCAKRLSGGRVPRKDLIERQLTKAILKDGGDDFFD